MWKRPTAQPGFEGGRGVMRVGKGEGPAVPWTPHEEATGPPLSPGDAHHSPDLQDCDRSADLCSWKPPVRGALS